jgi:hypothetical protein
VQEVHAEVDDSSDEEIASSSSMAVRYGDYLQVRYQP